MTQAQFNTDFKATYPHFKVMTLTDRRLYYNGLMETYRANGQITERQANNWGHPKFLTTNKNLINCNAY